MKKELQTQFTTRQYMLKKDFEIYYYNNLHDENLKYHVENHVHDYYEFYFFISGGVSMTIGRNSFPLTTGDMVLIPPGVFHQAVILDPALPYRRFVFWISKDFCNSLFSESPDYLYLMQQADLKRGFIHHYDTISFNALQSKAFQLLEEILSDHYGKTANVSLKVHDLILHLNRTVYESLHEKSYKEEQNLYQHLAEFIEAHLDEDLSLERLAGAFFVSKYYIAHLFKDHMGLSLHQYILKKRLDLAKDAILSGAESTEICARFGFNDYSAFYRAFKKEYGVSPREYSRTYRSI